MRGMVHGTARMLHPDEVTRGSAVMALTLHRIPVHMLPSTDARRGRLAFLLLFAWVSGKSSYSANHASTDTPHNAHRHKPEDYRAHARTVTISRTTIVQYYGVSEVGDASYALRILLRLSDPLFPWRMRRDCQHQHDPDSVSVKARSGSFLWQEWLTAVLESGSSLEMRGQLCKFGNGERVGG